MSVPVEHQLLAAHESGHAIARIRLRLGVGAIALREDGSGATYRVPPLDFVRLADAVLDDEGLTPLEKELIASHAGPVAEERWYTEELGLGPRLPHSSPGDEAAVRFLLGRFPGQVRKAPSMRRETALMAQALVDDHWSAVKRLVKALCRGPLPVRLPGRLVERIVGAPARYASWSQEGSY